MAKVWKRYMRWSMTLWPPLLGAGIRIKRISPDWRAVDAEMKLRFWNANYVGTHYGGSLYSIADPFYMLMLIENLGPDYIVWDKAATIRFRKPGRGRVSAQFRLSQEQIDEIRRALEVQPRVEPRFMVQVKDEDDTVVAEVEKVLHVRKKTVVGSE